MKINSEWIWGKIWGLWEKSILKGEFDPAKYWASRGKGFFFESYQRKYGWQHDWLAEKLKSIQWESLMEVGCGFGRNIKFIKDIYGDSKFIEGLEFSDPLIQKLHGFVQGMEGRIYNFSISDPGLPGKINHAYDVVLSHGLMMHVPFKSIDQALANIRKLTKKNFICIEETAGESLSSSSNINKFTFSHDYQSLLPKYGFVIREHVYKNKLTALLCEAV